VVKYPCFFLCYEGEGGGLIGGRTKRGVFGLWDVEIVGVLVEFVFVGFVPKESVG
jgi:hypothetical protein